MATSRVGSSPCRLCGTFTCRTSGCGKLTRRNPGPIVGVYFRIANEERVWVGHHNQAHRWLSAAEAVAAFLAAEDALGWEVVVPRRIDAAEIHRARRLPQVLGWR